MCKPKQIVLCNNLNCEICNKRRFSLLFPEQTKNLNKNNEFEPHQLSSRNRKCINFDCNICKHMFKLQLREIRSKINGVHFILIHHYVIKKDVKCVMIILLYHIIKYFI